MGSGAKTPKLADLDLNPPATLQAHNESIQQACFEYFKHYGGIAQVQAKNYLAAQAEIFKHIDGPARCPSAAKCYHQKTSRHALNEAGWHWGWKDEQLGLQDY